MFLKFVVLVSIVSTFGNSKSYATEPVIALVQYDADSHYGDYELNLENLTQLAASAATDGAQLIILPEGSSYGYASPTRLWCRPGLRTFMGKHCDDVSTAAEDVRLGKTTKHWHEFAKNHQATVLFSIMEKRDDQYFNTTVAVGPEGFIGSYQKMNLYVVDQAYATAGRDLFLLDFFGKSYGIMICMDTNYSSLFDAYKDAGADAIIAPMDWDQSPASSRAGVTFFRQQALRHSVDIYVSDQSNWDSTGYYPASGATRYRAPLAPIAVGADGYTLVSVGVN